MIPAAILASGVAAANAIGQRKANRTNRDIAREQMRFQERMSSTAYQRAVEDMRAAGLNPALAYQQGGASSPSGAGTRVESIVGQASSSAQQAALLRQSLRKATADADLAETNANAAFNTNQFLGIDGANYYSPEGAHVLASPGKGRLAKDGPFQQQWYAQLGLTQANAFRQNQEGLIRQPVAEMFQSPVGSLLPWMVPGGAAAKGVSSIFKGAKTWKTTRNIKKRLKK